MSTATGPHGPGELFLGEIREQPEALLRLLEQEAEFEAVTKAMRERRPAVVRLVGHGSSDAAASYGVYAFGLLPGWTAMRDSISLTVYYDAKLDLSDSVVIALSQSGETPDVVEYVKRARGKGAFTVAITNGAESSLADSADATLALAAGPERAVAASKTFLNTLAALAWVAGGAAERGSEISEGLRRVSDQLSEALESLEQAVANVAMAFAYVGRMYVIGRGIEFGTAREVALKLLETCRVAAEPMTATAFAHGPVAALDALFPVWAIASKNQNVSVVREAVARARAAGSTVVASGDAAADVDASYLLPTPEPSIPLLSPLLSVLPGQVFARALALAKGYDPDHPQRLEKVTLAR